MMILCKEEKQLLLEALCEKQVQMVMDNCTSYTSSKYKALEELKIKINTEIPVFDKCKRCNCEDDGK